MEDGARAPRLSASAGLVGKEMGAETELYSVHRRKATKLPDMQKKAKKRVDVLLRVMSNAHSLAGLGWEQEQTCQAKVKSYF